MIISFKWYVRSGMIVLKKSPQISPVTVAGNHSSNLSSRHLKAGTPLTPHKAGGVQRTFAESCLNDCSSGGNRLSLCFHPRLLLEETPIANAILEKRDIFVWARLLP